MINLLYTHVYSLFLFVEWHIMICYGKPLFLTVYCIYICMELLLFLLFFFLFFFFTMLCPIFKAQFYKSKLMVNEEIVENEDCKNLIEQFYNKIAKSNSMKTSTKKGE